MSPEEYRKRKESIERQARLMAASPEAKARWIKEEIAKLDLGAGVIKELPAVKAPPAAVKLKLRESGGKWIGRCPACAKVGKDNKCENLVIFEGGRFGCIAFKGELGRDHRSLMAKLCPALRGGKGSFVPVRQPDVSKEKAAVAAAVAELWRVIQQEFSGAISDLGPSAPIPDCPREQFVKWVQTCWQRPDQIWFGTRYDWSEVSQAADRKAGKEKNYPERRDFSRHLFHAAIPGQAEIAWQRIVEDGCDHTTGAVIKSSKLGRLEENLGHRRLIVVEHDGVGWPGQVALWRYCQVVLKLHLLAVVSTAGKGGHAHFDAVDISSDRLDGIRAELASFGADPNVLRGGATRIPGAIRQRDPSNPKKPFGGLQSLLWLTPETV